MLYLANSIATRAVRLSGRSAASRSRGVLTFHCAIVSIVFFFFFFFFLSDLPQSTEDEVEQCGPC